jgi:ferredoxin
MFQSTYFRSKCIGCNSHVEAAPQRWRVSTKDGRCTLSGGSEKKGIFTAKVSLAELEENKKAAKNCPVKIIRLKAQ